MTKFVVGYDQELAAVCFRRNLQQLIRPGSGPSGISVAEVNYFADRLAETSVFNRSPRIGSPWMSPNASLELVKRLARKMNRMEIVRCEHVANNVLILEGVISRAGALRAQTFEEAERLRKKIRVTELLYRKAALGVFRGADEKVVLNSMSLHVSDWIRYLSFLPGSDAADLLSSLESHQFYLS